MMTLKISSTEAIKKSIQHNLTVWQALRVIKKNSLSHLIVVQDNSAIGTISKDQLESANQFNNGEMQSIFDLMVRNPLMLSPHTTVKDAIKELKKTNLDHFLLVEENSRVINLISSLDLLEAHANEHQKICEAGLLKTAST